MNTLTLQQSDSWNTTHVTFYPTITGFHIIVSKGRNGEYLRTFVEVDLGHDFRNISAKSIYGTDVFAEGIEIFRGTIDYCVDLYRERNGVLTLPNSKKDADSGDIWGWNYKWELI